MLDIKPGPSNNFTVWRDNFNDSYNTIFLKKYVIYNDCATDKENYVPISYKKFNATIRSCLPLLYIEN